MSQEADSAYAPSDEMTYIQSQHSNSNVPPISNPPLRKDTYTVGDDVRMAMQRALWVTVSTLIAGQVPDDEGLVAGSRQQHVWVFQRGREGCNPSAVTLKGALENKLFRHVEGSLGGAQSICDVGLRRG